jgi:hypothetical protein
MALTRVTTRNSRVSDSTMGATRQSNANQYDDG